MSDTGDAGGRGSPIGRPRRRALTPEQVQEIDANISAGRWTQSEAARQFGVHPSTIRRALMRLKEEGS